MENSYKTEAFTDCRAESAGAGPRELRPGMLTIESLLDRMDAVRQEMLSMKDLASTMEAIANKGGEDDAGHIAEATSSAFVARETTCQQHLRFLERIYSDHFSVPSEEAKTARMHMILDNLNGVLPSLDISEENGRVEALRVIKELYNDLLKQP